MQFEIYFSDLNQETQGRVSDFFRTTEEEENWDVCPLFIIEREDNE